MSRTVSLSLTRRRAAQAASRAFWDLGATFELSLSYQIMRHVTAKRDANPYSQARRAAPHLTCASKVIIMGAFRIDNAGSFGSSAHRPAPWSCVAFPCVDELLLIELIDHRSGNPFSLLQWIQRVTQPSSHPNDARSCPPAPLAADIRPHHRSLHLLLISRTKKSEIENDMPSLSVRLQMGHLRVDSLGTLRSQC